MDYSPKKFQEQFEKYGSNLKKMYGQNFIIDENVINNIIEKAQIDKDTLVIEIGPGAGSLTYKLSQTAKNVICYEIDTTLKEILEENVINSNVEIIFNDFLKCNVNKDIKKYNYSKLYVVANLPYYITTPIITKIIEENIPVDKMVLMVQKEVGNRFKAKPNSKEYNSLSIYLNYYFDVKKILDISKNVFLPKPNVDSIILELISKKEKLYLKDKTLFFKLVKDSFKQKRKTIKNNLKSYDLDKISKILEKNSFNLNARAEQLPIDIFVEIANYLAHN